MASDLSGHLPGAVLCLIYIISFNSQNNPMRSLAILQMGKRRLETIGYSARGPCLRAGGARVHIQELASAPYSFTRVLGCWVSSCLSGDGRWGFGVKTFSPELSIVSLLFTLEGVKSTYDLMGVGGNRGCPRDSAVFSL